MHIDADFIAEHGIVPQRKKDTDTYDSIGFSELEQRWYGWTYHLSAGFGIGDSIPKGYSGYLASTPEEMIDDYSNFFADISEEVAAKYRNSCTVLPDRSGIIIFPGHLLLPIVEEEELLNWLDDPSGYTSLPTLDVSSQGQIKKCGLGSRPATTLQECYTLAYGFACEAY